MKIFGKSLKEYVAAVGNFLLIVIALTVVQVALFLFRLLPLMFVDPLGLLKVWFIGWAGWVAVKKHAFRPKHNVVVGLLLFVATIWALPVLWWAFPSDASTIFLALALAITLLVNLAIAIAAAVFGGWLAKKIGK